MARAPVQPQLEAHLVVRTLSERETSHRYNRELTITSAETPQYADLSVNTRWARVSRWSARFARDIALLCTCNYHQP